MDSSATHRLVYQIRELIRPSAGNPVSDRQLLARFAGQGDEAAFRTLVERHGAMVLGVGRRLLGDAHEAEDVFQAAFLVLARQAGSRRWRASVGPWLYQVAYRLALKTRSTRRQQRAALRQLPARQPSEPEADVSRRELARVLDEEVQRLPERYRLPIVLCYLEGQGNAEAAGRLGWRLSTLKGRLARARALLRGRLRRRGLALAGAAILLPETLAPAAVAGSLAASTVRIAALLLTTEAAGDGGASAVVTRLAEGMLHAMWVSKLKAVIAVMLVLLLTGGAGLLTRHVLQAPTTPPEPLAGRPGTSQPAAEKSARTDRFDGPLPEGALARLGTNRFRYGGGFHTVALSPDGRMLALGGLVRGIRLWETATGKELRHLPEDRHVLQVTFSPDGKRLAAVTNSPCVWDVATGKKLFDLVAHQYCRTARFSPDGKTLATGGEGPALCLWDMDTGREIRRLAVPQEEEIMALAFSPDGKVVAAGGAGKVVRLWDPATGKSLGTLTAHGDKVAAVAFSPDGQTLVSSSWDDTIRFWNRATQKAVGRLAAAADSLAFSPDGKILAVGNSGGTVTLWDAVAGKEIRRWRAGGGMMNSLAFFPDGQTLLTGVMWSCGPRLWGVATGEEIRPTAGHHGTVKWLSFSPDGRSLLTASLEKEILRWDLSTGRAQPWFDWFSDSHGSFTIAPDVRRVATRGGLNDAVRLWDIATRKDHPLPLINQDWDAGHPCNPVAFSPDGKFLAGPAKDGTIHVVEIDGPGDRRLTEKLPDILQAIAFSPDGKILAAGASNGRNDRWTLGLWDVATGKELRRVELSGFVSILRFSPDGRLLVSGGSVRDPVQLWDGHTGNALYQLAEPRSDYVYDLSFSPDGRFLALVNGYPNPALHVWEVCSGHQVRQFHGHLTGPWSVCFSPDGRSLASGGGDSTILLWDLTGRRKNGRLAALRLTDQDLVTRWHDLGGADAAKAFQAGWDLVAAPDQALAFLRERLRPEQPADPQRLTQWIADLDSPDFARRERAGTALEKLGTLGEKPLRQAVAGQVSVEQRRRLERLLEKLSGPVTRAEELRALRAVGVLEQIGTPARAVLQKLAAGAPESRLTREAQAALRRLEQPSRTGLAPRRPPGAKDGPRDAPPRVPR